jgi:hypothetical protein
MFSLAPLTPKKKVAPLLVFKLNFDEPPRCRGNDLVCMFHRTRTTGLENPQDSMLSDIATALVPITAAAWKTAQHFSYGARVLFARPSERSERLKLFVGHYS